MELNKAETNNTFGVSSRNGHEGQPWMLPGSSVFTESVNQLEKALASDGAGRVQEYRRLGGRACEVKVAPKVTRGAHSALLRGVHKK